MNQDYQESVVQRHCNKPLKLGFIGGGLSSAVGQVHFGASAMDGYWNLCAGAFSRDTSVNRATAEQWGVEPNRAYGCWKEMIEKEKNLLDAVAVLVPTPMHAEVVEELLEHDIPAICEKSLVNDKEELARLRKCFNADKHFLAVTYNYSGYPLIRELRHLISNGVLGEIKQFHFEMPQEGFVRPPQIAGKVAPPQSWRLKDAFVPMVSHDLGMHLHHLSSFLLDLEPLEVMAEYSSYSPYHDIVDTVFMWLKYENDVKGSYWFSKSALGHRNGMKLRIYGTQASAEWTQINPEEIRLSQADGSVRIIDRGGDSNVAGALRYNRMKPGHPAGFIEAFSNLYRDLYDDLVNWKTATHEIASPFVFGLEHAESGLRLFHSASVSNINKAWVAV